MAPTEIPIPRNSYPSAELVRTAIRECIRVFVIRLPLPAGVEQMIKRALSDRVWGAIERTVLETGARWIDLQNEGAYAEEELSDFLHLTSGGARRATVEIAHVIQVTR